MPPRRGNSPTKAKITDVFPGLEVEHQPKPSPSRTTVNTSTSSSTMGSHNFRLRQTIARAWPPFPSGKEEMRLTIDMNEIYRVYSSDKDPKKLFNKAARWISVIQPPPGISDVEQRTTEIEKAIKNSVTRAIFGSNQIERAGLGLDDTLQICRQILDGEDVGNIDERTPDYERKLMELYAKVEKSDYKTVPLKSFIRGRIEVVNHAKAFQLFLDGIVSLDLPFSERMIKDVHRVLCEETPIHHRDGQVTEGKDYAGRYRDIHVGGGDTMFTPPRFIAKKMKELIEGLNADIETVKATKKVDPFALAAKYSMQFVMIHPFQDGNGRMCRMILNVILCKFAGIVVPIGESQEDRKEYIEIKRRASRDASDHGEYALFVLDKSETRLRTIKKRLSGKK